MKKHSRGLQRKLEIADDKCLMSLVRRQQELMGIEWPWWRIGAIAVKVPAKLLRKKRHRKA